MRCKQHLILAAVVTALLPGAAIGSQLLQINLASSVLGMAPNFDPNLKNPWGISFAATSPIWVSDQFTGKSTLYNAAGVPQALVVTIPAGGSFNPPQGPTGQVFNSTASSFVLPVGGKSTFLFATLAGTIAGWNGGSGTTAQIAFTSINGSVYTGLALGNNGVSDFLYAADFANGHIDVINSSFVKTTLTGNFTDPLLPVGGGYVPYNIQNIGGNLYVEYSKVDPVTHEALEAPNNGVVSVFDTNGQFVQELVTENHLNAPWGVTIAPPGFANFGGDLLVGNFGDGTISAYNPGTGAFLGTLTDQSNNPIVNDGLWGIAFRPAAAGFDPNSLYFVAGINDEQDGLFGRIQAVPEPGTFLLVALAGCGLVLRRSLRTR